jgi:hypothetical protein
MARADEQYCELAQLGSEVLVEGPEVEQPHHHHTGRSWLDVVLGVSAVTISFISLFLAIHNGNAMERLVEANSWPSVQTTFSTLNQDSSPHIHLDIANKGVGPARIESLEVTYNDAPLSDGRAVLNAMLGRITTPPRPRVQTSTITHAVMAAKETITFVDFKPEEYSAEDYEAMRLGVRKLNFRTCYCSVFDECWIADTAKPRPTKVKECPAAASAF